MRRIKKIDKIYFWCLNIWRAMCCAITL